MVARAPGGFAAAMQGELVVSLRMLEHDPEARRRCVERSCAHPNGFTRVLVLAAAAAGGTGDAGGCVFLHTWHERRGGGDIHSHRFDFVSVVLEGCLLHERFAPSAAGSVTADAFRQSVSSTRHASSAVLTPEGVTRLAPVGTDVVAAGEIYAVGFRELHRVATAGSGPTRTFVVQSPDWRPTTEVLRTTKAPPGHYHPLSAEYCIDELRQGLRLCCQGWS